VSNWQHGNSHRPRIVPDRINLSEGDGGALASVALAAATDRMPEAERRGIDNISKT